MRLSMSFVTSRKFEPWEESYLRQYNGKLVRFGRCWWFWMPRLTWNGGKPWKNACSHAGIQWLCFDFTVFAWRKGKNANGPAISDAFSAPSN